MLLLPVFPGASARLAAIAVQGDARLLAVGPVPGSLVIIGNRSRLASGILGAGGLLLSAPVVLCGGIDAPEDES